MQSPRSSQPRRRLPPSRSHTEFAFGDPRFPRHSAHIDQELEIHYRWHPLYARKVRYRGSEQRGSGCVVHVDDGSGVVTVVPAWMLDPVVCVRAKAVRDEDREEIRAHHDPDILMFDVPPPFLSRGLDAYMETWKLFFGTAARPITFDFEDIQITAGDEVAFATAVGNCVYIPRGGEPTALKFRLTMGFRKVESQWRIVHEHHSVPATE